MLGAGSPDCLSPPQLYTLTGREGEKRQRGGENGEKKGEKRERDLQTNERGVGG